MNESAIFGGIKYILNKEDYTAAIIDSLRIAGDILIPRSITYYSQEYIITTIKEFSFLNNKNIRSIRFSEDSELVTIEPKSFSDSSLRSIIFPAGIENLKGFAESLSYLNYVSIPPKNKNFLIIDNSLIIGKSDPKSDNFDSLLFVSRDKIKVTIPPFIKYLNSFSFSNCKKLKEVNFTQDSELLMIETDTFFLSSIEKINLPPKLEKLEDGWCNYTSQLNSIIISDENKNFCYLYEDKKIILGKSNLDQDIFDIIIFGCRELSELIIPKYIKRIDSSAFSNCIFLESVEIEENSELESIGSNSFFRAPLYDFFIPKHVKIIENSAFNDCENIRSIKFDEDSELEIIDKNAFAGAFLEEIIEIPIHVKVIGSFAFNQCECFKTIYFKENCEIELFDSYSFAFSNLQTIVIPKSLKIIAQDAFNCCNKLTTITFQNDSQLESIEDGAFAETNIKEIKIPKHVKKIGKKAFYLCNCLEKVDFEEGSEIHSICKNAFQGTYLRFLEFPDNLIDLQEGWCNGTEDLYNIKISPKNTNFCYLNQEIIIGKSDANSENYDTLVFVNRYSETLKIPSFIKYIKPFAFSDSSNLLSLDFSEDSELISIDQNAFYTSGIESMNIPEKVEELKDGWCTSTIFFKSVSISENNKNFSFLPNQEKIMIGKSNKEQENYDVITFACRDIEIAFIPKYIK